VKRLFFPRESRVFCSCELYRLRFGRMLYRRSGGDPIRTYRQSIVTKTEV
jgi:hypothetical protein